MKKSELKNIIKECVKEVIFEEGVLSTIITEVATGLRGQPRLQEDGGRIPHGASPLPKQAATRRKVLDEIGNNSHDNIKQKLKNPQLFEGTKPIPSGNSQGSALSGMDPNDKGIDISRIPGFQNWSRVAGKE
jgi:hypothetical protein